MSPSFAPASMSAAITSVYAVIASWTPWIVVSRSLTIWEIDTFMMLLSSTITNCAAARMTIGSPSPSAGRSCSAASIGLSAAIGFSCVGLLDLVGRWLAHRPVDDRADDRHDDHDQDPRGRRPRAEVPAHDVDDRQHDDEEDHDADECPEEAHARIVLHPADADNRARTPKP